MNFSLNEVEATAKKATRGVGYPWGIAEEAAKAVRWLCGNGVDGCAALAGLLERFDGAELEDRMPVPGQCEWHARNGVLCPLTTGAALSDRALDLTEREIRIGQVAAPSLFLPFAAFAARQMRNTVTVVWTDGIAVSDGDRLGFSGQMGADADRITVRRGGQLGAVNPRSSRATPDGHVWDMLHLFAHRTYAPTTEASRLLGAGAGLTDTD